VRKIPSHNKDVVLSRILEDEKVSTDELQEKIAESEDYVQSTDIAAMQSKLHLHGFSNLLLISPVRTLDLFWVATACTLSLKILNVFDSENLCLERSISLRQTRSSFVDV